MIKTIKYETLLVLIAFLIMFTPIVKADSLWTDQSTSLYGNQTRTFRVGDLVTVIIVEQAKATQEAKTSSGEKGSVSAGPGTGILSNLLPEQVGLGWDNNAEGRGTTTRGGSLQAKITVQVKDVNPNGILSVEGRQVIKVNDEDQVLNISGLIRAEDISNENVVLSTSMANAVIEYQGKGTVGDVQKPGILTKIFNWVF